MKILTKIKYLYWDVESFFINTYIKICRSLSYAKFGWSNYDFDHAYLLEIQVMKLKRMLDCFENYGHHCHTCPNYKPKMKSLRLAIKLGEKLRTDAYQKFLDIYLKKYGNGFGGW